MAFSGHGFAVEVGVGDGFGDNAAVVGGVAQSNDCFHVNASLRMTVAEGSSLLV